MEVEWGGAFSKPQLLSLAESDSRRFGKIHLGECEYSNHTQAGFVLAGECWPFASIKCSCQAGENINGHDL